MPPLGKRGSAIMLSIVDGTFAALTVLPFALVFFLAYGNRARKLTRPSLVRTTRRRRKA